MSTRVAGSEAPPWKQRFRAPLILSAQLATARPTRGLVVTNQQSPVFQLYAWDVASGGLRQCTTRPHGVFEGWIAPDGQHIYYLDDHAGNELGHVVRVPFEGGPAADMTPDLPPYTLRGVGWSRDGSRMAFNPINVDGFQLRVITLHADGTCGPPDLIHQSDHEAWGALLSYDGSIATMYSTARAGGQRRYSLLAFDTGSAEQIGEIWDGPEASVEAELFSPVAGDERVLAFTGSVATEWAL